MPLTLEATWWNDNLHLWGHNGDTSGVRSPLDHEALRTAVSEWAPDPLLVSAVAASKIEIHPPTANGGVPRTTLTPTLAFSAVDALELLAGAAPANPMWGAGLSWWSHVARFAASLLVRRQFVPDIETVPAGGFCGWWRPHLATRADADWLESVIAAMPGVCDAVPEEHADAPSVVHSAESFIEAAIDGFIRRTASEDAFLEGIHERAVDSGRPEVLWLSALLGNAVAQPDAHWVPEFADRVRAWTGKLDDIGSAEDLRLCFTLCEPEDPPGGWGVELHLQSPADDRRVDIDRVWAGSGDHPTLLRRHLGRRRDRLLADLAKAEETFPALSRLSRLDSPQRLELDAHEAHTFIRESAPLLESRDFGVTLPAWTRERERQFGLRLLVNPRGSAGDAAHLMLGLDQLIDFDWRIAVGDRDLTLDEFAELASRGEPLIRYGDSWLELDGHEARTALEFVQDRPAGNMTLRDAFQLAHGIAPSDAGLPLIGMRGTGWIDELLRELPSIATNPPEQPPAFRGTLRPYQLRGLGWLDHLDGYGIGGCLADDMGLGKTIQIIALLLRERERGACGPTLIVAPTSLLGNWRRELERFAPDLRVSVHHGPGRRDACDFAEHARNCDVIITTYALAHRDHGDLLSVAWHRVVLDEAQKIKNPHARQTRAIRKLPAARRVALTGTPVENHLSDLWSIMDVLNPGLLGPPGHFRNHFVVPIEKMGDRDRARELRGLLRPFLLRREKSDPAVIRDLPARLDMRVYCNLTPEQAALYEDTVGRMLTGIQGSGGIRRRAMVLALLTRLKQICNHPAQIEKKTARAVTDPAVLSQRSGKGERLIEMLEEILDEGDSALVFTQYRKMGHLLEMLIRSRLPEAGVQFLHGGTPQTGRERMIEHFQATSGGQVFLLSLRAGGFGLNLTAANHVFHFDRWWNPAVEDQATDRAHRVGQTRVVQVHKFVCIGTVEERIDSMLEEKRSMAEQIVTSGEQFMVDLPTEQLREMLRLGQEAMG